MLRKADFLFPTNRYVGGTFSRKVVAGPPVEGQTWVERIGSLSVSGNDIIGQTIAQPVTLMGMSLFWSIWGSQVYWNAGVVQWLADDWKINIIRAPMAVEINDGAGSQGY